MAVIRFAFRVISTLLLAAAVVVAVVDATRSIAAEALLTTTLAEAWAQISPGLLADAVSNVANSDFYLAKTLFEGLLGVGVVGVLVILAMVFYIMGRRPTRRAGRLHDGA